MRNADFVKAYKEDAKYYKTCEELNAIKSFDLEKNSSLLDVGAGVGRLSIPLSDFFKVTALDIDSRLLKEIKQRNICKVKGDVLSYNPKDKFSILLLSYPNFGPNVDVTNIVKHFKNSLLRKNGKLILIMGCNKLGKSKWLTDYKKMLKPYFKILEEKLVETGYFYKSFETAFKSTKFRDEFFRRKKLTNADLTKLRNSLNKCKDKVGNIYLSAFVKILLYQSR